MCSTLELRTDITGPRSGAGDQMVEDRADRGALIRAGPPDGVDLTGRWPMQRDGDQAFAQGRPGQPRHERDDVAADHQGHLRGEVVDEVVHLRAARRIREHPPEPLVAYGPRRTGDPGASIEVVTGQRTSEAREGVVLRHDDVT